MPKNKKRAQIFQSFDALKGLRELLIQQERVVVDKKILSEDDLELLDRKVKHIKPGMIITVVYYDHHQYIQLKGMVSKIHLETYYLQIVKTSISLKDIVSIEFENDCMMF